MTRAEAMQMEHETSTSVEADEREANARPSSHKERVRASLAWALKEHASTLAKLAK